MQLVLELLHGPLLVPGHHHSVPKLMEDQILLCCWVVSKILQLPADNLVLEVLHDPSGGGGGMDQHQSQAARGVEHAKPGEGEVCNSYGKEVKM